MTQKIFYNITALSLFLNMAFLCGGGTAAAEKVVLKDKNVIFGGGARRMGDTVWIDVGSGKIGHNIDDILYIYNDDGTISDLSPRSDDEAVAEIQQGLIEDISRRRRLSVISGIESDELTGQEIKEFYSKRMREYAPKGLISSEEKVLKKLKLAPADFDYAALSDRFLRKEIAGFYDRIDKKLYISSSVPRKLRSVVIPHELVHALQDQNYDLQAILPRIYDNTDLMQARTALVEGDATITSYDLNYAKQGTSIKDVPDISGLTAEAVEMSLKRDAAFSRYPAFLQEEFMFPYLMGGSFVHKILQNYSYDKLNEVFKDPPNSTEQIMHIDKYLFRRDEPVYVKIKPIPGLSEKWKRFYSDRWGEYAIYSFLKQSNEIVFARAAAAGWGGDNLVGYENTGNGDIMLIWCTVWDTSPDADEFYRAYITTIEKRYKDAIAAEIRSAADEEVTFESEGEGLLYAGKKDKIVVTIESIESKLPMDKIKGLLAAVWKSIDAREDSRGYTP